MNNFGGTPFRSSNKKAPQCFYFFLKFLILLVTAITIYISVCVHLKFPSAFFCENVFLYTDP